MIEILSLYFSECNGNFNIPLSTAVEKELNSILQRGDIELNNLKATQNLETEDWVKLINKFCRTK
jgi:hypothetical protein